MSAVEASSAILAALILFAACSLCLLSGLIIWFRDLSCEYKKRCRYYQKDGFDCNCNLGLDCGAHNRWDERRDAWLVKAEAKC
jgi:hypothetical protein